MNIYFTGTPVVSCLVLVVMDIFGFVCLFGGGLCAGRGGGLGFVFVGFICLFLLVKAADLKVTDSITSLELVKHWRAKDLEGKIRFPLQFFIK